MISYPRSVWCIKGANESTLVTDSSVPLMHHDPSDQESLILILITPKEQILNKFVMLQDLIIIQLNSQPHQQCVLHCMTMSMSIILALSMVLGHDL